MNPSASSRFGSLLLPASVDVRFSDDVIAFEGVPMNHMVTIYSLAADEVDSLAANDVVVFDESEFRATRRAPEKFTYYLARVRSNTSNTDRKGCTVSAACCVLCVRHAAC